MNKKFTKGMLIKKNNNKHFFNIQMSFEIINYKYNNLFIFKNDALYSYCTCPSK